MQDASAAPTVYDLGHYMRPIWRHKVFVAICLVVGIGLGVGVATTLKNSYQSVSHVLVLTDTTTANTGSAVGGRTTGSDANMDTEAQIAKSVAVATIVKKVLKSPLTPTQIASHLTISVPANTTVLDLTYQAGSASSAQAGANAFASAYLQNRGALSNGELTSQIAAAQHQLTADMATLARSSSHVETASLTSQVKYLNQQITTLKTTPVTPGRILGTASPGKAKRVKQIVAVASIALLGLLFGLILAGLIDRRGRSVRSEDDLATAGVNTLWFAKRRDHTRPEHVTATAIASALGARGVAYLTGISSTSTSIRFGLRVADDLQLLGKTVQIIVTERQRRAGGRRTRRAGASGEQPLSSTGLQAQIAADAEEVDYVLIVGSDAERDVDAYVSASVSDVVVLVVERGETTRAGLRSVVAEINATSAQILGGVLVASEREPETDAEDLPTTAEANSFNRAAVRQE